MRASRDPKIQQFFPVNGIARPVSNADIRFTEYLRRFFLAVGTLSRIMLVIPTVEANRMCNAGARSNAEPRCRTPWL
jgi:hypothetical protein